MQRCLSPDSVEWPVTDDKATTVDSKDLPGAKVERTGTLLSPSDSKNGYYLGDPVNNERCGRCGNVPPSRVLTMN